MKIGGAWRDYNTASLKQKISTMGTKGTMRIYLSTESRWSTTWFLSPSDQISCRF